MTIPASQKIICLGDLTFDLNYLYNESPAIFKRPIDMRIHVLLNKVQNYNSYLNKYCTLFFETQDSTMVDDLKKSLKELVEIITELSTYVPDEKINYKSMCLMTSENIGILDQYII